MVQPSEKPRVPSARHRPWSPLRYIRAPASAEKDLEKPFRQLRTIQIALRQTPATDVQLPNLTHGHRLPTLVEHVHPVVVERLSDAAGLSETILPESAGLLSKWSFRRPVGIPQHATGRRQSPSQGTDQGFTAGDGDELRIPGQPDSNSAFHQEGVA